jgi:hypothetical protein
MIEVVYAEKRLWTYPLDLSGSPPQVEQNLTLLASWILDHATERPVGLQATA